MDKKVMGILVVILIILLLGLSFYFLTNKDSKIENNNNQEEANNKEDNQENESLVQNGKVLVVYYSAQNHTKVIAQKIAKNLKADIFEIVPVDKYTSLDLDWTDENSRVSKEHDDESLRDIPLVSTSVDNWENYDMVFIGYPIWWGIAAWPINHFVEENNFDGKIVIPFCTSASSGLGQSGKLLEELAGSGNWREGIRFSSSAPDNDIKEFTDSIW